MKDIPIKCIEDDRLGIHNFISSLINIIKVGSTPFTISLHGEWGSGKTGVLNILKKNLDSIYGYKTIMFNTWQYSQVSNIENIDIALFKYIMSELGRSDDKKINKKIKKCIKFLDILIENKIIQNSYISSISNILKLIPGLNDKNHPSDYSSLKNMKENFQEIVDECIHDTGKLIILIDDMDRIDPKSILHLLSSIKMFFDIRKCVFVIALDYDTFSKNIIDKYSNDYTHADYLDKIIQLNISIPVNSYNIDTFVDEQFKFKDKIKNWSECKEFNMLSEYTKLIENSIGKNPRSIKRLAYKYIFYRDLFMKSTNQNKIFNYQSQALFALICLKESYHAIYEEITVKRRYDLSFILEIVEILKGILYKNIDTPNNILDKIDTNIHQTIIQVHTNKDYKKLVSMYNFLISFIESISVNIDNRTKFKHGEKMLFENLSNLISDRKISSFYYKIDKPFKLDDISREYINYLNEQCPFPEKQESYIYKDTYDGTHSICLKYSVGAFSFIFSIEKYEDGIHAFLIDRDNTATSYRKYIYHWASKKLTGLPMCQYDIGSKFVIFTPITYLESMKNDYIGSNDDFFKETTFHMMKNFIL